jgi:hypothetical protein
MGESISDLLKTERPGCESDLSSETLELQKQKMLRVLESSNPPGRKNCKRY